MKLTNLYIVSILLAYFQFLCLSYKLGSLPKYHQKSRSIKGDKSLFFASHIDIKDKIDFMNNGPLILLDVDGVINTLGGTPPWDDIESDIINKFKIVWSKKVVSTLNKWSRHSFAEILWLTTWNHNAQLHLAPRLNLDYFMLARNTYLYHYDKIPTFLEYHKKFPKRKIIWLDDDSDKFMDWIKENYPELDLSNVVNISPTKQTGGLVKEELDKVEEILKNDPAGIAYRKIIDDTMKKIGKKIDFDDTHYKI